ncbi:MAG: hypothetical protein ACLRT4_04655 [Thomasclavelia sp.]
MKSQKNLLLIAPVFFDYYKEIIKELELQRFQVDYVCDAPSDSNLSKAIGRVNKNLIRNSTKKYFKKKVLPIINTKEYQYVLLVAGMTFSFTPDMINEIKEKNPNATFIMYQWDSEKNLPYSKGIHRYFDKIFSFDLNDCKNNDIYNFLPLFYTKIYKEIGNKKVEEFDYDCCYIGTAHPQKYKYINELSNQLKDVMPKQFIYHYMPSKLKYFYHKVKDSEFKKARIKEFKMNKLSSENITEIIKKSKCILDSPQNGQTGLTIRTIECLGAKRKLITTNLEIKKYNFYNENNILVYDGRINYDSAFFSNSYIEVDENIYEKYSLQNWLKHMIEL